MPRKDWRYALRLAALQSLPRSRGVFYEPLWKFELFQQIEFNFHTTHVVGGPVSFCAGATPNRTLASISGQWEEVAKKRFPDATPKERAIDVLLLSQGHDVQPIPRHRQWGVPQADRIVDGFITEYKTMSEVRRTDPHSLYTALRNRIRKARRQAAYIIVDVREQFGMNRRIAEEGIRLGYKDDKKGRIQSIRVIGKSFDVTLLRKDYLTT